MTQGGRVSVPGKGEGIVKLKIPREHQRPRKNVFSFVTALGKACHNIIMSLLVRVPRNSAFSSSTQFRLTTISKQEANQRGLRSSLPCKYCVSNGPYCKNWSCKQNDYLPLFFKSSQNSVTGSLQPKGVNPVQVFHRKFSP